MALDQYTATKTPDQRAAVVDYLQHLDRKMVAGALVDHILAAQNGTEATAYDGLVESLNPDGCAAILDRLGKTDHPTAKGKLIVALRRCQGDESRAALAHCLGDKRPVPFEAHGPQPRRVCDLAYDELFLQLRTDPRYGLDPSPRMLGVITEKIPVPVRDALIARLKAKLALKLPAPSPAPSMTPQGPRPDTAAITLL